MSGHRRWGHSPHNNPGEKGFPRGMMGGSPSDAFPPSRLSRPISWIVVLVGLGVWTLLAWVGYALVDPVLGWAAANAGLVLDTGKGLATGAGKEAASALQSMNASGVLGQTILFLRAVLKPAIVVLWAIGALTILAMPLILPRLGSLLDRRRH